MLRERFEVAVEEEVQQIRIFNFDEAVEFLERVSSVLQLVSS